MMSFPALSLVLTERWDVERCHPEGNSEHVAVSLLRCDWKRVKVVRNDCVNLGMDIKDQLKMCNTLNLASIKEL